MIKLKNSRLEILMETPGEGYRGSRYDWSSFITGIILDGKYNFAGVESKIAGKGSGGKGLCGEFCMYDPPGYEEAPVGGYFLKLGVGLVRKAADQVYSFSEPLEYLPIPWNMLVKTDQAVFSCRQELLNGFAYELKKKISLQTNAMTIDYELHNTGERAIVTSEYNHNYLCMNDAPTGKDYSLSINFDPVFNRRTPHILYKNRLFSFQDQIPREFFCEDIHSCIGKLGAWRLTNKSLGLSVSEVLSAPIRKFALFGKSHTICPELFVDINLPAGKSFSWQRKWNFEKTDNAQESSGAIPGKGIFTDIGKAL